MIEWLWEFLSQEYGFGPENPKTAPSTLDVIGTMALVAVIVLIILWLRSVTGDDRRTVKNFRPDPGLQAGTGAGVTEGERAELEAAVALPERVEIELQELPDMGGHIQPVHTGRARTYSEPIAGRDLAEALHKVGQVETEEVYEGR